jgi:oligoribonuclease NrnB/cAMP/cGMP phosphodiesterase (DHH superfamily)
MSKPFKIIVHNDLDGGASAICIANHIKYKYGEDAKWTVAFKTYQNVNQYVERILDNADSFEKVFIADISVEDYIAKEFPDNFILLDHHDTAEALDGLNKCIVDTSGNHCGASLCYKHLLKDEGLPYKHLTKLVAVSLDYDLWHHKLPNKVAKNLNFLYYRYWGEKFMIRFMDGFNGFNDEEKEYLRNKWEEIAEEIKNTEIVDLYEDGDEHVGKICLAVLPSNKGEVNEICENALDNLGYKVIITVNSRQQKLSIRSCAEAEEKGLHVGELNDELGIGGGHSRAGGATFTDDNHLEKICESYAEKIIQIGL